MDSDKAYLLGLIIGGGIWGNPEDGFRIRLPYKQWGSYEQDPKRAGLISGDIMRVVGPMFRNTYGISVSYDTVKSGEWNILCEGDLSSLKEDLSRYRIKCEGELRKKSSIDLLLCDLVDTNMKRRFIAGLADTIGSTKQSHRRFSDEKQMISFEISGFEFQFVCSLCKLLHSIKCYPDQILWNHPNFHCPSNPYDKQWKKGFKLRVFLDQYSNFGAFAFSSKADSAVKNKSLETHENIAVPCEEKKYATPSQSCVHCDESSMLLPENIRSGHYIHNRHVCAVLGCEHAPYKLISTYLSRAENYISPFPILIKGTRVEIEKILLQAPIFANRIYSEHDIPLLSLFSQYKKNSHAMLFQKNDAGYPINQIMKGVTYLAAAKIGLLNGLRPAGSQLKILTQYLKQWPDGSVHIQVPDLFTPIILTIDEYSAFVGANNPSVYKKLIQRSPDNQYKLLVSPITESDMK